MPLSASQTGINDPGYSPSNCPHLHNAPLPASRASVSSFRAMKTAQAFPDALSGRGVTAFRRFRGAFAIGHDRIICDRIIGIL